MKYENAKDILPAKLLEEVQKYAEGKVIYIPKCEKAKGWGEASGYRDKLKKRNELICNRYSAGKSILEIAEEFYLSPETIKKLVYGKKVQTPVFSSSISSAEKYMAAGMGEEWVRIYLEEHGRSMPDLNRYTVSQLVRIPIRLITEEAMEDIGIESEVAYDVPLIVLFEKRKFIVPYQQDKFLSLKKEKKNSHYAFIFVKMEEYEYFWNHFGKHFQR